MVHIRVRSVQLGSFLGSIRFDSTRFGLEGGGGGGRGLRSNTIRIPAARPVFSLLGFGLGKYKKMLYYSDGHTALDMRMWDPSTPTQGFAAGYVSSSCPCYTRVSPVLNPGGDSKRKTQHTHIPTATIRLLIRDTRGTHHKTRASASVPKHTQANPAKAVHDKLQHPHADAHEITPGRALNKNDSSLTFFRR